MWTQQRWPQRPAPESEPWPNHNRRFPQQQQQQQQRSILHPRVPSAFMTSRVPFFAANALPPYPFPSTFQNQEPKAMGVNPASQNYYRGSSHRPPHHPPFLNSHHPAMQGTTHWEPGQLYNSGTSHHFYQSSSHRSHSSSSGNQQTYQPHGFQYSPASNLSSPSSTKKMYHPKGTNRFGISGQPLPLQKVGQVVENHPRPNQDHSGTHSSISETVPKHTGIPQSLPLTKRSFVDSAENTSSHIQQNPHFPFTEDIPQSDANVSKTVTVKYNDLSSCEKVKDIKIETTALESPSSVSGIKTTTAQYVSTPLETQANDGMHQQNTYQFLKQMKGEVEKMKIIRDKTSHFLLEPGRKHRLGLLGTEAQVRKRSISLSSSPVQTQRTEFWQIGENSGVNKEGRSQSVSLPFNCQIDSQLCQNSWQQKGQHISSLSPVLGLEKAFTVMEQCELSNDETVFLKNDSPNCMAELPSFCEDQINKELTSTLLGTQSLSLKSSPAFLGEFSNSPLVTSGISGESLLSQLAGASPEQAGRQLVGTTQVACMENVSIVQSTPVLSHRPSDSPQTSSCCFKASQKAEQDLKDLCHLNGTTSAQLSDLFSSPEEKFELESASLPAGSSCLLQTPSAFSLPAASPCLLQDSNRPSSESWNSCSLLAPSACSTQSTKFGNRVASPALIPVNSCTFNFPCNLCEKCRTLSSEPGRNSHSVEMCPVDVSNSNLVKMGPGIVQLTKLPDPSLADCKGASSPLISGDPCLKQDDSFSSINEHEENIGKYKENISQHEKTGCAANFVPELKNIFSPRSDSQLLLNTGPMRSQCTSVSAVDSDLFGIHNNVSQPTEQHPLYLLERPSRELRHQLGNLCSTSENQNEQKTDLFADVDSCHIKGSNENVAKNNLFLNTSMPYTKTELCHIPVEMDSDHSIMKWEKSELSSSSFSISLKPIPVKVATPGIAETSVENLHCHINAVATLRPVENQLILPFEEHTIELPFNKDQEKSPLVTGHTSPVVTGEIALPLDSSHKTPTSLLSGQSNPHLVSAHIPTSPLVSGQTTSPLVACEIALSPASGHISPVVTGETTLPLVIGEITPPSLIRGQSTPDLVSVHTTPPSLVSYQTTSPMVTGHTSSSLVSGQTKSPLVNDHTVLPPVICQKNPTLVINHTTLPLASGQANKDLQTSSRHPAIATRVTDILEASLIQPALPLQDKHQHLSPQTGNLSASSRLSNDDQVTEVATARNYCDKSELTDLVEKSCSANHSMYSNSELTKNGQLCLNSLCDSALMSCQVRLASTFSSSEALSDCASAQSSSPSMNHSHGVPRLLLTTTGPENSDEDNCPHLVSQLLFDASVVNSELESDSEIPLLEEIQPEGVYAASSEHEHLKTFTAELTSKQTSHTDAVATSTESHSSLADDSVVSLTPKERTNFSWRKNIKALSLNISTSQANKSLKGRRLKQLDSQEKRLNHEHFHSADMGDLSRQRRSTRSSALPLDKPAGNKHNRKQTTLNSTSSIQSSLLQPTRKRRKAGETPYVVVGKFKGHRMMKVKITKLSIMPQQSVSANFFEKLAIKDVVRKVLPTNQIDGLLSCDQHRGVGTHPKLTNPRPKLKYLNIFEFLNEAQILETDDRQTLQNDSVCVKTSQNIFPCKKRKLETAQASSLANSNEENKSGEADTFFADFKDIFIKNFNRNKPVSSETVKENSSIFFEGVFSSYFQQKLISNMQKFRSCGYSSSSDDEEDVLDGAIFREKITPPLPPFENTDTAQSSGDTAAEVISSENNDEVVGHRNIISMNIEESVDQGELTNKSLIKKDQVREATYLGCDAKVSLEEKGKLPAGVSECLEDLGSVRELVVESDAKVMEQEDIIYTSGRQRALMEQEDALIRSERHTTLMEQEDTCTVPRSQMAIRQQDDAFIRSERQTKLMEQEDTFIRSERQTTLMEHEDAFIRSERQTTLREHEDAFIRSERQTTLMEHEDAFIISERQTTLREQEDAFIISERQTTVMEQEDAFIRSERDTKESCDDDVSPFITCSDSVRETEDYLKCQMAFFEDISSDSDSSQTVVTSTFLDSVFQGSTLDQVPTPYSNSASFPDKYGGSPLRKYLPLHLVVSNASIHTDRYDNLEGSKVGSLPKPNESQVSNVHLLGADLGIDKSDFLEASVILGISEDEEAGQETLVSPAPKDGDESFLKGEFQVTGNESKSCMLNPGYDDALKPNNSVMAEVRVTSGTGKLQKRGRQSRKTKIVEDKKLDSSVLESTQDLMENNCSLYLSRNLRERKKTCYKQKPMEEIDSSEDESSSSSFDEFVTSGSQHKGSKRTKSKTAKDEMLLFKPVQIVAGGKRTSRGRQKSRLPRRRKKKGSSEGKLLNSLSLLHMATLANLTETQSNLSSERPLSVNDLSNSQNGMYFSQWKSETEHNADLHVEDQESVNKQRTQVNEGESDLRSLKVGKLGSIGKNEKSSAKTEVPLTKSLHLQTSLASLNVCCKSSNTEPHSVFDLVSSSMVPSNFTFNVFGSSDVNCCIDEAGPSNTLQLLETKRAQVNCASYSMKDILKLTSQDESMDSDSRDSSLPMNPARLPKKPKLSSSSTSSQNPQNFVNTDQVHLPKNDEGVSFSGKWKPELSTSEFFVSGTSGMTVEPPVKPSEQLDQFETSRCKTLKTSSLTRDVDLADGRTKLSTRKSSSSRFHASLSHTKDLRSISQKLGGSTSRPAAKSSSDSTSPVIISDASLPHSTSTLHHKSYSKTPVVCLTRQTSDFTLSGNAIKCPKHRTNQDGAAVPTQIGQLSANLNTACELSHQVPQIPTLPTVQVPKTPMSPAAAGEILENPSHLLSTEKVKKEKSALPNFVSFQPRLSSISAQALNSTHVSDKVQNPLNLASFRPNSWKWSQLQLGSDCAVSPINASGPPLSPNKYSPITPTSPMSPNYPPQTQGSHLSPSERDPALPPHWFPWVKVTSQAQISEISQVALAKPGGKRVSATTSAALKSIHKLEPLVHKVSAQRQLWKENYAVRKSNNSEASNVKPVSEMPEYFSQCDKKDAKTAPEGGGEDSNAQRCVLSQESAVGEGVDLQPGASCLVSSPRTCNTASRTANASVAPVFLNQDGETRSKVVVNKSRSVRPARIDMSNDARAENKDDCDVTDKVKI